MSGSPQDKQAEEMVQLLMGVVLMALTVVGVAVLMLVQVANIFGR